MTNRTLGPGIAMMHEGGEAEGEQLVGGDGHVVQSAAAARAEAVR